MTQPDLRDAARPDLAERYGTRRGARRRWQVPVVSAGGAAAGLAVAIAGYLTFGSAPIEAGLLGWTVRSDSRVEFRLEVRRDDPGRPGVCLVRALGADHGTVGELEVDVPPHTTYVDGQLTTSARAVLTEVHGCKYAGV